MPPAEIAKNRDAWLREWGDITQPMTASTSGAPAPGVARPGGPARCWCSAVFFVLPVAGMVGRGFFVDGSFDPVGVLEVLGRGRVHRVLWFTALVRGRWRPR